MRNSLISLLLGSFVTVSASCGGGTGEAEDGGGVVGSGGRTGSGGQTGGGGKIGSGGAVGSGGKVGGGGQTGGGGAVGSGGKVGSGGAVGSGGKVGSGGVVGSGGKVGSGGVVGSGGKVGSGGQTGSGGSGSGGQGGQVTCGGGTASAGDITVTLSDVKQSISGFGASTAWGSSMSTGDADLLWSTTTGAGLSLHRVRINYDKTTNPTSSELPIAKLAVARGVKVWATPWTPPAAWKTGSTGNNGEVMGTLTTSHYQDYANYLKSFATNMAAQGVPIYAVSAQNEPDANVDYESCVYTGATMTTFVGQYMGPTFAGTGVKVMAPESQNWCGFPNFYNAMWADANAKKYTDIVATHEYGCSVKAYPEIQAAGKEFWETEIYDTAAGDTLDAGMTSALRIAKLIHDALTVANMNAWHHWWVYSSGNGGLFSTAGNTTKRLWVEGNYARFIRPGYVRVGTSGTAPSGVSVSAYKNPVDGTVVVVAINSNTTSTANLSLFISGASPCSMTPYVTSDGDSLGSKSAVTVSSSRTTYTLPAKSVTTLVGKL